MPQRMRGNPFYGQYEIGSPRHGPQSPRGPGGDRAVLGAMPAPRGEGSHGPVFFFGLTLTYTIILKLSLSYLLWAPYRWRHRTLGRGSPFDIAREHDFPAKSSNRKDPCILSRHFQSAPVYTRRTSLYIAMRLYLLRCFGSTSFVLASPHIEAGDEEKGLHERCHRDEIRYRYRGLLMDSTGWTGEIPITY